MESEGQDGEMERGKRADEERGEEGERRGGERREEICCARGVSVVDQGGAHPRPRAHFLEHEGLAECGTIFDGIRSDQRLVRPQHPAEQHQSQRRCRVGCRTVVPQHFHCRLVMKIQG
eukprot:102837-Rhodomonas_salina.2